ncbi:MAG TPA: MlaA family lipoprotein [Methylomirabilota bacterium]|nr:MlaA family lipoprotein [Methylomirabilota bacterium]
MAVLLTGCGTLSELLKSDDSAGTLSARPETSAPIVVAAAVETAPAPPTVTLPTPAAAEREMAALDASATMLTHSPEPEAGQPLRLEDDDNNSGSALAQQKNDPDALEEDYDPWESFNEKMFSFNRNLDKYLLKPVARAYRFVMPEPWQVLISNGFDNINFVPRMVNSLLQAKWGGAGRELGRFLINSTFGIGGVFDPAKDFFGIPKSREDFGQTLGVWGAGAGPYLILPFMEPLTVRDGIGRAVDGFMDPLSYLLPFIWDRIGMKIGDTINDRALNYDLFQGFEESVIDMYSAVRHGYLQRRQQLIKE